MNGSFGQILTLAFKKVDNMGTRLVDSAVVSVLTLLQARKVRRSG